MRDYPENMALSIRSNNASARAQRSLADASDRVATSNTRLASGMRINTAADDAAGLSIASQLNMSSRVFNQGMRNINDGMSLLNVAEGALSQLTNITERQKELAEQAANGVYSTRQRDALHKEALALTSEYNRIVSSTKMNGISLLDGTLSGGLRIQAGYGVEGSISIAIGDAISGLVGDGTFQAQRTIAVAGAARMNRGDVNGDGNDDFVVLTPTQPQVFIGNGDGSFKAPVSYAGGTTNVNVHLADLDGNNSLDMVVLDVSTAYILLNNGDGTFKARQSYAAPSAAQGLAVGDLDKDGRIDMLVAGGTSVSLLRGNGDGTFKAHTTFALTGLAQTTVVADLNGDGNPDFYALDETNRILNVFMGNGDGTFKARVTYAGAGAGNAVLVDINGDGIRDHVAPNGSLGFSNVSILLGNADGTFQAERSYYSGPSPHNVYGADFNGDGNIDLVTANLVDSTASVLFNNGDGTFKAPVTYANALRVRIGDFNGDGVTDLLTTNTNSVGIYLGNARATTSIAPIDLTTQQDARAALPTLDRTQSKLLSELGKIGAFRQRLTTALSNLSTARENFIAAESRIKDVDIAEESAKFVRNQISQQAAAAVAAKSNRMPEIVLSLLS